MRSVLLVLPLLASCAGGSGGGDDRFGIRTKPVRQVEAGTAYAYALKAENAGGKLTWELLEGPVGMALSAAGELTWSPVYADLGEHQVRVGVSDGSDSAEQAFFLRVHQGLALGVTFSPRGHTTGWTAQDFVDHYENRVHGKLVAFHGHWRDDVTDDGEIPSLITTAFTAAARYGFTPALGVGWADGEGEPDLTSESDPGNNSWTNPETASEFLSMVQDLAATHQPPYLFLGNETNSYYATHTAQEWADWVAVRNQAYNVVKGASPDTMVSTVFQLERMKGLPPFNDPVHWDLVDALETSGKADALAFTSYPYLAYSTPGAVPLDYYDEIADHWTGPVVFTEIGWLSAPSGPYPGGEAEQEAFVGSFFDLTDDLDLEYVTWLFLHDWDGQAGVPAFAGIGFRDNLAAVLRPADAAWQAAVVLRERP